jgi:hypothetical protein
MTMCYVGILSCFCEFHGPALIMATVIINKSMLEDVVPKIMSELQEDGTKVECPFFKKIIEFIKIYFFRIFKKIALNFSKYLKKNIFLFYGVN